MEWENNILQSLEWSDSIINRAEKEKVAKEIALKVKDGEVIGVGSGSTSYLALLAISERIKNEHLSIKAIPTSLEISMTCSKLGIPVTSLMENKPDWAFDGADEVDPNKNLIKGRGGAMFKEKLLISSSSKVFIIVDETKLVPKLGTNFPVPVEIFPGAILLVEQKLKGLGISDLSLRLAKGKDGPIITENGNFILDVWCKDISTDLESKIKQIPGVIESGLFIGYNVEIIVSKK